MNEEEILRYLEEIEETTTSSNIYLNQLSNSVHEIKMAIGYYPSGEDTLIERDIEYLKTQNNSIILVAIIMAMLVLLNFVERCFK